MGNHIANAVLAIADAQKTRDREKQLDEEAYQRQRATGIPAEQIKRELKFDLIRDGGAPANSLLAKLKNALGLEAKARTALADAEALRAEAAALQSIWDELVSEHETMRERIGIAEEQLGQFRATREGYRGGILDGMGKPMTVTTQKLFATICELAGLEIGVPCMEGAVKTLRAELAAHAQQMRAWGQTNGVPAAILANLETA